MRERGIFLNTTEGSCVEVSKERKERKDISVSEEVVSLGIMSDGELKETVNQKTEKEEIDMTVTKETKNEGVEEVKKVNRSELIRQDFLNNMKRSEISKKYGVRYQIVYQVTKNMENIHHNSETTGRTKLMEYNGKMIQRSEYFRKKFMEGFERSEISKECGVRYQTVYSSTRSITPNMRIPRNPDQLFIEDYTGVVGEYWNPELKKVVHK